MVHRGLVYIFLLNVPSFSSHYFKQNKTNVSFREIARLIARNSLITAIVIFYKCCLFCGSFMFFCLVFAMPFCLSIYMCLVVTCWERAYLLALVYGVWLWVCYFPIGILGQVWYLIVLIPGHCTLTYFIYSNSIILFALLLYVPSQQLWSWRDGQFT